MSIKSARSPEFIDLTGKVALPYGQRPLVRPPFADEVKYWEALNERADPNYNFSTNQFNYGLNNAETWYIFWLAYHRSSNQHSGQRRRSRRDIEYFKEEVKGMLPKNIEFWSEERIRVSRTLLSDYQDYCKAYTPINLKFEDIPWVVEDEKVLDKALPNEERLVAAFTETATGAIFWSTRFINNSSRYGLVENYYVEVFAHELTHYFGKRVIYRNTNDERVPVQAGFYRLGRFAFFNEAITSAIGNDFLHNSGIVNYNHDFTERERIRQESGMEPLFYYQNIQFLAALNLILQHSNADFNLIDYEASYFTGRQRVFFMAVDQVFKSVGGLAKLIALSDKCLEGSDNKKIKTQKTLKEFMEGATQIVPLRDAIDSLPFQPALV